MNNLAPSMAAFHRQPINEPALDHSTHAFLSTKYLKIKVTPKPSDWIRNDPSLKYS